MTVPVTYKQLLGNATVVAAVTVGLVLALPVAASARPGQRGASRPAPAKRPARPSANARPSHAATAKRTSRPNVRRPTTKRPVRSVRPTAKRPGRVEAKVGKPRAPRTANPNIKRPNTADRKTSSRAPRVNTPKHTASQGHAPAPKAGFKKHNTGGKRKFKARRGTTRPKK